MVEDFNGNAFLMDQDKRKIQTAVKGISTQKRSIIAQGGQQNTVLVQDF